MRRTLSIALVLAAVVAACTSGGGVSVTTDGSLPIGGSTSAGSDVVTSNSVGGDGAPVALPGLLDTSDEPIPNDPDVRTGTLDNGLRYFVRANDNPGGKAELRLAVNAGSVDEFGASTGTAHFVEHMLFNGTELFPENELIDVLRSFGAEFGADINAATSFDETVYSLTVPNAPQSLEAGLTVLEQWLSHASFDPAQVVAERGVVLDEWRVRTQSTEGRLFDVAERLFLAGSAYEGRAPIGTDESIANMTETELREFYDAWYRPDNAAVVVVGDIDVDDLAADLERLFGPAIARRDAVAPVDVEFGLDIDPEFGLLADPDQRTVDVEVTLPLPAFRGAGTAAWRLDLTDQIVEDVLVRRLDQDLAADRAPFDRISSGTNSFVATLDAPSLYTSTDAARVDDTLQALLDEYARADRFGFTVAEVELAKSALRAGYESLYAGRESAQDAAFADEYVDHFLTGSPYPSIADEYDISLAILDGITAEAIDLRFRARWDNSAPHVIVSAPEAVVDEMPSDAEVMALIDALDRRELAPRSDGRDLPDTLMERPPAVSPESIDNLLDGGSQFLDPIEIRYPNGVRVILNTNKIVEGQIFVQAGSPGGSSLVDDDDVVDALYAADVVTAGGVADYDQAELDQIIAGRDVEVSAWITPYRENLAGSAATADVEVLLQLLHLYMTQPRFDPVALRQVESRVGPVVEDPASSPDLAGQDALLDARYPGELRYALLPTPQQFTTLDLAGVERVWTSRFGNAADWVFVFAGDFDIDAVTELAGAYLGTLPASGAEQWIDVEDPPPPGVVRATTRAGTGDTASVLLLFTTAVDDVDARLRVTADVATKVIDARLTDVIRERNGDSYSPFAVSFVTTDPDPVIETYVSVTGAPDRIATVAALVEAELADLAAAGPSEAEFANAFAQVQEALNFVNNGEFITELLDDAIDPALELDDYVFEFAELGNVTTGSLQSYIAEHLPSDRFIEITVLPR